MEVGRQDWQGHAGWAQLPKQPGAEGARHRVILSRLVDPSLCVHPAPQAQRKNTLPAYTVESLPAHVHVACLVDVIDDRVSPEAPQDQLKRVTQACSEGVAFGRSKKYMMQRHLGRLGPTPSLQYRAYEVMRNMPVMST